LRGRARGADHLQRERLAVVGASRRTLAESEHDGVAAAIEAIVLEPAAARRWHDLATAFRTASNTQDAELSERVAARLIAAGNR